MFIKQEIKLVWPYQHRKAVLALSQKDSNLGRARDATQDLVTRNQRSCQLHQPHTVQLHKKKRIHNIYALMFILYNLYKQAPRKQN